MYIIQRFVVDEMIRGISISTNDVGAFTVRSLAAIRFLRKNMFVVIDNIYQQGAPTSG